MSLRSRINGLEYGQLGDDPPALRAVKLSDWLPGSTFLGIGSYLYESGIRATFVFARGSDCRAVAPAEAPLVGRALPSGVTKRKVVDRSPREVRKRIEALAEARVLQAHLGEILPRLGGLALILDGGDTLGFYGKFAILTAWERGKKPAGAEEDQGPLP